MPEQVDTDVRFDPTLHYIVVNRKPSDFLRVIVGQDLELGRIVAAMTSALSNALPHRVVTEKEDQVELFYDVHLFDWPVRVRVHLTDNLSPAGNKLIAYIARIEPRKE